MAIFDKTPRTASDLSLTRTNEPFSKDVSKRLQTQKAQFVVNVAENQRLRKIQKAKMEEEKRQKEIARVAEAQRLIIKNQRLRDLKRQTMEAEKRQKAIFEKVQKLESKSETITLDLADKISKIIPYSLIPVIAITAGYLLIKGKK